MTEPAPSSVLPASPPSSPVRGRWSGRLFPGDLRVWRWSLLVLIPALVVIGYEMLKPVTFYTGTDNVAPTVLLSPLRGGQQLCTAGVALPADTGAIDLSYGWPQGGPLRTDVSIAVGGRVIARGTSTVHPNPAPEETQIPLSPAIGSGVRTRTATVCVRDGGRHELQLAGFPSIYPGLRSTIGHTQQGYTIAIWLSPPVGQRRSLVDNWASMMRRLTVFRPAFAGVVFYWLLFCAGLPLIVYLGIRLLAQATFLSTRRLAAWVALLAFCGGGAWAISTCAFDAPDEPAHFAYTELLAQTGKAPSVAGASPYASDLTDALSAVHQFTIIGTTGSRRPWLGSQVDAYQQLITRTHPSESNGVGIAIATAPHSPLYYTLLVPGYELGHPNIFTELFWMRLTSSLLGALLGVSVLLALRELVPGRPEWAVGGALLVTFQPMVSFMSGAVNNDNGVNALAALSVYLTVRLLRRGLTPLGCLALGIALGLLPLMKATGFALFPAIGFVLVVLLARDRSWRALGSLAMTVLGFVVVFGIWALVAHHFHRSTIPIPTNIIAPNAGTVVAAGAQASSGSFLSGLGAKFSQFIEVFIPDFPGLSRHFAPGIWPLNYIYIKHGFADFGWGGIYFPNWVYRAIDGVMAAAGLLGLWTAVRCRRALRRRWLDAVFLLALILSVIFVVEYSYYTPTPRVPSVMPEQGRYAFTALVPLAALAVSGLLGLRRSVAGVVLTLGVGTMIAFAVASHLLYLAANFT